MLARILSSSIYVVEKCLELAGARGLAQLAQCLGFDLANTLAGDGERPGNLLQRVLRAVLQTKAHLDYLLFTRAEGVQHVRGLFLQVRVDGGVGLEQRLAAVRRRMDQGYQDKQDGKIPEDFWERKMSEWRAEEQRIQIAIKGLQESSADHVLSAKRILEFANDAYPLYLTQNPTEQAKLLRMVLLNCSIDAASVYPTYRKPFDTIFQRAQ